MRATINHKENMSDGPFEQVYILAFNTVAVDSKVITFAVVMRADRSVGTVSADRLTMHSAPEL